MSEFIEYVRSLPKAELHLHIEGTLEPLMLMALAKKHQVDLPYSTAADVELAYDFADLQSFLDLYYLGASVLVDEDDFYSLMFRYLERCRDEGIVHTEMMFDPQTHTGRGIGFPVFMAGFSRAMEDAKREWGQSSSLIMCFLRHLPEESAFEMLKSAEPYQNQIMSIGLDSSELGHPPEKFERVYAAASLQGYRLVAHAGEEGPPTYIIDALDRLKVERIDHGVRCLEDAELVERLVKAETPLTVCPLSNVRLCVFETMADHPIRQMLARGLNVMVNSDDPPYFGGYLLDNFEALHHELGLTMEDARQLAINSIHSSFVDQASCKLWLDQLSVPTP
jgi:adenosine deaminase